MVLFSGIVVFIGVLISILLQKKNEHGHAASHAGHGHDESGLELKVHDPFNVEPPVRDKEKREALYPGKKSAQAQYESDPTKYAVKGMEHELEGARQRMPGPRKLADKVRLMFENVRNIAVNAVDNTVGVPIAHYQNWKTAKYLKAHPDTKNPVLYLMHGLAQTIGSQWRLASQARELGIQPYHLKGKHALGDTGAAEDAFHQIEHLHHQTHLHNPSKRKDYYSGHSSGGNVGIEMAANEKIKKYGIHQVQARAPTPHGFKRMSTIEQKAAGMILDIEGENLGTSKAAREGALRKYERQPHVPVYIVSGREDALVPPNETVYKHAKGYHVLQHKDATHFGTSGVNREVNKKTLDLIVDPKLYRPVDWYAKKPESAKNKVDLFGRDSAAKPEMERWNKERAKYHGHEYHAPGKHYHGAPKQGHGAEQKHAAHGHH
ncbi:MAG: hypothetical protein Q7R76_04410 [Candidatus Woesearchaeota archaeon]|nr:hypothetical protein [Candidatus Woesearchaeota archaeon]